MENRPVFSKVTGFWFRGGAYAVVRGCASGEVGEGGFSRAFWSVPVGFIVWYGVLYCVSSCAGGRGRGRGRGTTPC
jgi:hypothetical protein